MGGQKVKFLWQVRLDEVGERKGKAWGTAGMMEEKAHMFQEGGQ